jgi:glycosyltransferase involved in cell wall biosynthesis
VEGEVAPIIKSIAIVSNTSWYIYNFRLGLLNSLQSQGCKIIIIAPRDEYSSKLKSLGFEYHDIKINNKGTNPLEDMKLIYDFYKLYKSTIPDIILLNTIKPNIYGSMAAGILGIPVISNISGLGTVFLNEKLSSKIARLLYKLALRVPKKVFYQNIHDKELFIKSNYVKKEQTDLLPGSGIDTDKFKPFSKDSNKNEVMRFLFIGRLLKDKGLIEYVEASKLMNTHRKVECCILGSFYSDNPSAISKHEMNRWEAQGFIKYIGVSDNVKSIISDYDCVVLPSYREGLSKVLLESASMAKPIITTDVPGCREVVDDGVNGYLCKPKNIEDLAKKMKLMFDLSYEARKTMGEAGRIKIKKEFDENIVIDKYLNAIEGIVGKL